MAAPPFKVKAVYEYTSEHDDDLSFPIGQVITVTELEGDDWYVGAYSDPTGAKKEGLFPANFVERYEPEVPTRPSRPTRTRQDAPSAAVEPPASTLPDPADDEGPPTPPAAVPVSAPSVASRAVEPLSPPVSAASLVSQEVPPAPRPTPVEPVESVAAAAPPSAKKPPPPVAVKSNAFKDRIAAFNQTAAAPIAPIQPGRKTQTTDFIKKPFVAPPPSKNAYVPTPKAEPVVRPYLREEDPEIKQRQEEDRAAAEAAGLTSDGAPIAQDDDAEDVPKPMTLKERMALLQQQQQEQAQRRAETATKKKAPTQRPLDPEDPAAEAEEQEPAVAAQRRSVESARPPVPAAPREPIPVVPETEVLSDGHEADQSAVDDVNETDSGTLGPDDNDEPAPAPQRHPAPVLSEPDDGEEDGATERDVEAEQPEEEREEEDDSMDEEERRKQELRARMARLGGAQAGMGVMLGFGGPPPAPPRKKAPSKDSKPGTEGEQPTSPEPQRIAMVPIPGMPRMQSPESDSTQRVQHDDEDEDEQTGAPPPPPRRVPTSERAVPPPVPKESRPVPPPSAQERGAAPPVPAAARPPASRPIPPPPPAAAPPSPGPGSESDDEMSMHAKRSSAEVSGVDTALPIRTGPPPVPVSREVPARPSQPQDTARSSRFGNIDAPGSPRPPPPPPPASAALGATPPVAAALLHEDEVRMSSEYDGDYDTDIASSATHKDALKAQAKRDLDLTDSPTTTDDASAPPPVPGRAPASAPRAVPPPPPQTSPRSRPSMDRPPPPVPPPRDATEDDSYDPYRYADPTRAPPRPPNAAPVAAPPVPAATESEATPDESSADELYEATPDLSRRSTERVPPPPPQERPPPPASQAPAAKRSLDVARGAPSGRVSMEGRPSGDHGQIANDIDLAAGGTWWTAAQPLPPVFQSRNGVDLTSECEESSKSKRGGRTEITKDIYVLFMDYSQTVISVRYDSQDPGEVSLEQRHEPPPPRLRQDQLEAAWQRFGRNIAAAANTLGSSKKDSIAGDGAPASLPRELIRSNPAALQPVGARAYGALVYANLANASTLQYDEIRAGDVLTLRGARFEGHHGAMKSRYKADYGPSHVAVVDEWDGTKRAVRAWEQGREPRRNGVRSEKFRLADLRSGEVRVWRVVGRDWVGWDS